MEYLSESTNFYGPHYVECYIIKDGICVARDKIAVNIDYDQKFIQKYCILSINSVYYLSR